MAIHSICLVKNEADIIEDTLKSASKWSDFIYVYDNGSTDGTWEKVLNLAKSHTNVVPYKQDDCVFNVCMRGDVFRDFRGRTSAGDWWCQLDADEIYIDDPREFLSQVPKAFQLVWCASFNYFFSDVDYQKYLQNPALYADEVPVSEKCRYYLNNWSEARFFRYDPRLIWERDRRWPFLGAVYPVRIRLKHYQYRSPQQIQKRIEIRRKAISNGCETFRHEARSAVDWQRRISNSSTSTAVTTPLPDSSIGQEWVERIVKAENLYFDNLTGDYVLREDLMPKIPQVPILHPYVMNRVRILKKFLTRPYKRA